jgi:transcription factor SPT20
MATAQVARAAQAPRRRDPPRPSSTKRSAPGDAAPEQAAKKPRLSEPFVRDSQYILRKHKGKPPSMTIHLHPSHFRFENQDGSFAYDSPMRFVLQHLQRGTVPHEIMGDLLSAKVQFYDGCLVVEVHNHRGAGGKKLGPRDKSADKEKFSMHNYNEHITPSPYAPYPSKAQAAAEAQALEKTNDNTPERPKGKEKEGTRVSTVVLHPTEQTKHEELMILARTPLSEIRNKKKAGDPSTTGAAESSAPLTPGGSSNTQSEKMALDQGELYSFQADQLVTTEPPLYLEPAHDSDEAQAILDLLANPLHSGKPPSPRERKRTTAEMAADDAQAAEAERRMLIMDERIKPAARTAAGAATSDNQSAAASLGFSRFKTIEMVRQNHEKAEREKKEEEARLAVEKRQFEEQAAQQQKALVAQKQRETQQKQVQAQRQAAAQQQAEMMRQQQLQAQQLQQQNMMQNHGHPNNLIQNQQANFQHAQVAGVQGSPINRQQSHTPMMQSSPMVQQGGFPMVSQPSNTGAGSPPRPGSANLQHNGVAMARNLSQQAPGSRNHTPQMTNTPSMAQAMPGRQPSQTPRMMQPGSPDIGMAQNTPNGMMMQGAGQMGQNMTPEQMAILQTQRALHTGQGVPNGQNLGGNSASMTPEHIQFAQQMARFQQMFAAYQRQYQEQNSMGNHENAAKCKQQAMMVQSRLNQMKNAMAQRQQMGGNAGSPGMNMQQPTPQMGHSHPGFQQQQQQQAHQQMQQMSQQGNMQDHSGMTQQQQAALAQQQFASRNAQAQAQLHALLQKHGGQPPPQVVANLPPYLRQLLQQQSQKQQQARMQAQAQARMQQGQHPQQQQQQQQQNGGGGVGNEQYVQHLQRMQSQLGMQMGQPQQQQQTPGGGMMPMGMNNMQQFGQQVQQQQQGQGQNDPLNAHFAAMANTLQRGGQGMQ